MDRTPYTRHVDADHPGCVVFLIDQSYSMLEPVAGKPELSKADAVGDAVNGLLADLAVRCIKDAADGPADYYDVAVVGYGEHVGPCLGGMLAGRDLVPIGELARHPLRVDEYAVSGGSKRAPVWFDAAASGGTPMSTAINRCGAIVAPWVQSHPDSFPPVVVNVSDGAATDGDPGVWAERLRLLRTDDGPVLFFNVNVSSLSADPVCFPSSEEDLRDDFARYLFRMSSPLPPSMGDLARERGHAVDGGARGFVFNADIDALTAFLQIATSTHGAAGR